MIVRVQPNAGHAVFFLATSKVFLPIRQFRIDRAEWKEEIAPASLAVYGQASVDRRNIAMEQAVEAAGPRLSYTFGPKVGNQAVRVVAVEPAERPTV
jgi:hypothetical protein